MRKKSIKVLALDTSSKVTGWALFINGKYKKSGVIDLHDNRDSEDRTRQMCKSVSELIKSSSPTQVVIEELPSTRNARTTRLLSRIIGAVYYHCVINGLPYEEIQVSTWRSIVGIDNKTREKAKEESIIRATKYKKNLNDDEADAINIGDAYCIKVSKEKTYEI